MAAESLSVFRTWAPRESPWSPWAKPTLFAQALLAPQQQTAEQIASQVPAIPALSLDTLPKPTTRTALILDLPGIVSVQCALQLASRGYQPIPLFNSTIGYEHRNLVDARGIVRAIWLYTEALRACKVPADAPPVFLLDSFRHTGTPNENVYDNRWLIFPQDLPSAHKLRSASITSAIIIQNHGRILHDLRAILRNWRNDSLPVTAFDPFTNTPFGLDFEMSRLAQLRDHLELLFHSFKATSAGGFGALIPDTSTSSGFA